MTEFKAVKVGDQVKVDFVSESRTEFSGNHFTGEGVVDRVEDDRVFGRLDNGMPFMCGVDDVQVITGQSDIHDTFQKWFTEQAFYKNMRFIYGENLFHKDLGVYRILPVQMTFKAWEDRKSQLNNIEQCYIQKKKQVDDCAALAKEWRTLAREMCPLDDKYVIGARLGCAQDIEEVLRGEHETK